MKCFLVKRLKWQVSCLKDIFHIYEIIAITILCEAIGYAYYDADKKNVKLKCVTISRRKFSS